jgi:endo-1,4-beta-xylanase
MMDYTKLVKKLFLLSCVLLFLNACDKKTTNSEEEIPKLYTKSNFPVGTAVDINKLKNNAKYRETVINHFNSITAENAMKMDALHPAENEYNWSDSDYLASFCNQYNKHLHGHTLIWHQRVPNWIKNYKDTTQVENVIKNHIQTVVSHFKGKVKSWDVVNEAFGEEGLLRDSFWKQKLGNDYIAKCLKWVKEADPDVKLFYNDYFLLLPSSKFSAIFAMIDDFQKRNPPVPIDGIGIQMHVTDTYPDTSQIRELINEAKKRNLLVHFSELDVSLNPNGGNNELTEDLRQSQKDRYKSIVLNYRILSIELQFGITTWGVGDGDSWIRSYFNRIDWPLLFDENYEPKPAFYGFVEGLQ